MGVENRYGEVGHIDVPLVGSGDETAVGPEFSAMARLVRKSETDCRGPIWRVALWFWASSQRSVTLVLSAGGSRRGEPIRWKCGWKRRH